MTRRRLMPARKPGRSAGGASKEWGAGYIGSVIAATRERRVHGEWPRQTSRRSRFAQSRVRSSARASRANSSSISSAVMISGGQTVTVSPIDGAHDQPFLLGEAHAAGGDALLGIESALARLVGDELEAAHQPHAARLAHQRMLAELLEMLLELRDARRRARRTPCRARRFPASSPPPRPPPDGPNR